MTDFTVAECAIRQLHARYLDAVFRKDFDAFANCFTEDAEWRISGMILRGRTEIAGNLKRLMPNFHRVLMTWRTPIVEVGDGVASSRTYVTEQNAFFNGRPGTTVGTYFERFVDQGDQWRFTWRMFQLHYIGPPDITASIFPNPEFGPPPGMPPLDALPANNSGLGVKSTQ